MGKKERKEEEELIHQTREYKHSFRKSLREELFEEMEKRHANGEIFFEGQWVPKDKISKIQRSLLRRRLIVFLEIHGVFLFIVLSNLILLWIFKIFLLP